LQLFLYFPKTSEIGWAINAHRILDTSYRCHCLLFRVLFLIRIFLCSYQHAPEGTAVIFTNTPLQLLSYTFFELHDMSMGHACLVCTQFIFPTLRKVGSYRFPSPSNGSLLILSLSLFITMVLSVEETLMNFGYTYAPNLIHQGASVIIEILSRKWLQESNIFKQLLVHPWTKSDQKFISKRSKTIQPVIKSTCTKDIQAARARAPVENAGKEHMRPMCDCGCKNPCTAQNDAFMILVGLPPTSGSSSKSI
jgi:hypothetical protein